VGVLGEGNLVMKEGAWKLGDAAHTELLNKVPYIPNSSPSDNFICNRLFIIECFLLFAAFSAFLPIISFLGIN